MKHPEFYDNQNSFTTFTGVLYYLLSSNISPVLKNAPVPDSLWSSDSCSHIINIIRYKWQFRFKRWLLHPWEAALIRRLGGLHSQSGCMGQRTFPWREFPSPGNVPVTSQNLLHSTVEPIPYTQTLFSIDFNIISVNFISTVLSLFFKVANQIIYGIPTYTMPPENFTHFIIFDSFTFKISGKGSKCQRYLLRRMPKFPYQEV